MDAGAFLKGENLSIQVQKVDIVFFLTIYDRDFDKFKIARKEP